MATLYIRIYVHHTHSRETDESGMEVSREGEMGFHINYGSYIMLTYVHHKIVKCHTCNMTTHTFKQELPMISYDI